MRSDHDDVSRFWGYRKSRPTTQTGNADRTFDKEEMVLEMREMKHSLRNFIMERYWEDVRAEASKHSSLFMKGTEISPVSPTDIKRSFGRLQLNEVNQDVVYEVAHKFHRDRTWLAKKIDMWFVQENMELMDATPVEPGDSGSKKHKTYHQARGSFGVVARAGKSQAVTALMDHMLSKAGWCLATANQKSKEKEYGSKLFAKGNKKHFYYVVKQKESATAGESSTTSDRQVR